MAKQTKKTVTKKAPVKKAAAKKAPVKKAAPKKPKLKTVAEKKAEAAARRKASLQPSGGKSNTIEHLPPRKTNGQISKENWKAVKDDKKVRQGMFRYCTPYCSCKDVGGKNNISGLLMHCADSQGMTVEGVAARPTILRTVGLRPSDLTPAIVSHAKGMMAAWWLAIQARVDAYNAKIGDLKETPEFGPATATNIKHAGTENGELVVGSSKPKAKRVPGEKKAPKVKVEVERDRFTNRVGSQAATINALLTKKPITCQAVSDKTGYPVSRIKSHMKFLLERNFIVESKKGYAVK